VARYRIIPERSTVSISARSNVHPIHSTTDGLEGWVDLEFGPDGVIDLTVKPAAQLSLPVRRLSSGNALEDRELQKRIDARRFPSILGVLRSIEQAPADSRYRVSGEITFRGAARPHQDQMTIRRVDDETLALAGQSRFDIREFGMEPPRFLMLKVEPQVDVVVDIIARKEV
jgi:polyisoprenoid-binding protein YceI